MADNNFYLRELDSIPFYPSRVRESFVEIVVERLGDLLPPKKKDEKARLLAGLVSQVVLSGRRFRTVRDTRDRTKRDVKPRVQLWDALVARGLVSKCTGSESSGSVTRYFALNPLLELFNENEWETKDMIDLELRKDPELRAESDALVVLKRNRKDRTRNDLYLPIPESWREYVEAMGDQLDFINARNLEHTWQGWREDPISGKERCFQPNVMLQQQHVGNMLDYTRLYTPGPFGGQSMSKDERRSLLIDEQWIAELDYSCCALRLGYHLAKIDPDPEEDLYCPHKLFPKSYRKFRNDPQTLKCLRDVVKKATNIALNASSVVAAARSLEKWVKDELPNVGRCFREDNLNETKLIKAVLRIHPILCRGVFFRKAGRFLMPLESSIMLKVCLAFAVNHKPVLPIHDGLVCRVSDAKFARETMIRAYQRIMDFRPVVKRAY